MNKTIAILLLLCGAVALAAQTTGPTLSANAQAGSAACVAMGGLKPFCDQKALLEELVITAQSAYQSTVSAEFTADETRITKLEAVAPVPGPAGPSGPPGPQGSQGATGPQGPAGTSPNLTAILADIATLKQQVQALQSQPPPALAYGLSVSVTPDRLNATDLNGATVKGLVYIFTAARSGIQNFNPAGVGTACYMLDGTAIRASCETQTPYDFIGGSVTVALPWASTTVPNGPHTITQKVTTLAGTTETDIVTFTVAN